MAGDNKDDGQVTMNKPSRPYCIYLTNNIVVGFLKSDPELTISAGASQAYQVV